MVLQSNASQASLHMRALKIRSLDPLNQNWGRMESGIFKRSFSDSYDAALVRLPILFISWHSVLLNYGCLLVSLY